ncbi:MAG: hypothetical protein Greene041619_803 [Candidatus Peregrinibacteria bacterium Greene0416_19]|nr:MAG: hypothetical protein Greene041619_803 [Candidatus Peregrinibacteria bacterium Greene0416_19]
MESSKRLLFLLLCLLFCLPFGVWTVARSVSAILYERDCGGHLKRAADANTIELADQELAIAVRYLEANRMTEGYTSIVYTVPSEDVGFWYRNLKASLEELRKIPSDASQLEKSNVLLKLRQTLLDHKGSGEEVTNPVGISVFPHNTLYMIWAVVGLILFIVGAICLLAALQE